ncbi:hypothetical protein [Rheinheimera sediminis]|uniref:hypothetical protein n=1 Tax=Rheinheimera sp. YQF-1 TaxID=2499626 RepID=UPI00164410B4|nr:hypothetical protein [Rheinheimera sp. YQF-1]
MYLQAGLSPLEVIQTATMNSAIFAEDQANSIRLNLNLLWDALMSAPMRQQFAD